MTKCLFWLVSMFIYSHTIVQHINDESMNAGTPVLYQKITIPKPLQTQSADLVYGGDIRIGDFTGNGQVDFLVYRAAEMIIRHNGHKPDAMLVKNNGTVVNRYQLNESPNNTGMTEIYWNGHGKPALLFNGGVLWRGNGQLFAELPDLPPPVGNKKMGWYHCIPANACGDDREEIITYNPWDKHIYIFTPAPFKKIMFERYIPGPRQYNVRLMD